MQKYASRACLVHVFDFCAFPQKPANSRTMLETFIRATFPMCTCDSDLQHVAVANDLLQNSYSRTRMLLRMPTKPVRYYQNFMQMLQFDIMMRSQLADCDSEHVYNDKTCISVIFPLEPRRGLPRTPESFREPQVGSRKRPNASESVRRLPEAPECSPKAPESSRETRGLPRAPEGP